MSYEQAMKHSKNHRKDRFYQQCSGYGGDGVSHQKLEKEIQELAVSSFKKLLEEAKSADFPIYISECGGGFYCIVDEKNLFGQRIDSYEELVQFGKDYVGYDEFAPVTNKLSDKIARAEAISHKDKSSSLNLEHETER
ncbi:MAG: hypothetical protein IJZ42_13215 [Lachnospiraceae bacterium]|nr:hypothetical protein [Lachnospiraceae bacterium]